ncbi:MAG TPA: hypothetical protein VF841_12130 [Anaeromyxobacter sp.]
MKRVTLAILVATALLSIVVARTLSLDDDPIRSLTDPDPAVAALFERFQERSPFRGRIFVETGALPSRDREALEARLAGAGYVEEPLFRAPPPQEVLALAPLLPADDLRALLGDDAVRRRADEAASVAGLPGGDGYLAALEADPAMLGPALLARLSGPRGGGGGAAPRVFRSPSPMDYERAGEVYDALVALGPAVHFIGGDFFAVENYRAVKRDMVLCSTLSLVLSLAVFFLFNGRWALVGLLLLGTAVSYLTGLLAIRAFYAQVFAVVLAYTSTFVGFNNESLVHLSGIEERDARRSLLGVWSAIGTTVIGFLVLLLGRSVMVRQMALASLGGTAGFLLFLVPYRRVLRAVRFRPVDWPKLTVSPGAVAAACGACAVGVAVLGVPRLDTRIEDFRFQTPALDAQVAHFSRALDALALENVVAVPVAGAPGAALADLAARGLVDASRHPLSLWRPPAAQEESLRVLREEWPGATARLVARLAGAGIRIAPPPRPPDDLRPIGEWELLDRLGALSPIRWADRAGGHRYLFVGLRPGVAPPAGAALLAMSPRHHYDALLTGLSRELGWLFLAGFAAMALYLGLLQRSLARVLYVFAPLFPSALAFAAYARVTGAPLSIVHVMGFSLVIALALDYTAVAVSTDHRPLELSKVLLTGLTTLATFGVLVLARHPVMRELGVTVAIGCGISLAFALFVRLPAADEGGA